MLVFFTLCSPSQAAVAIDITGAIDGNVNIDAGGHYREQGAIVHAGRAGGPLTKEQWLALSPAERNRAGNVYLNAQSAELDVMRGEQKQEMNSRYKQTGITVNLSGALVNAAQMARKNLQHLGKSDNARVKAMAAANAAWSGYKAVQAVNEAVQSGSGGTLINLSISGGSQHSSSHQKSREDILQSSQLTGDSGVYLNIRGKGAGSTLNITGSDLGGSAVTMLNVEGKKTFQAAETRREIHSDQHSGGGGGGIALQGGSNGGGLGITANANIGKGETNGNSTTYRLSHIGGLSGHTDIGDGKTLLNGAQILGKSIEGNTRDLEIHSPQGTMDYQSRQNALSGNVLYGYGVSVNLDYQNTRVDAHEKTVNIDSGQRDAVRGVQESGNNRIQALTGSIKQNDALANSGQDKTGGVSGFYAGDDGYRIHNTGTTVLGGLITSTAKAEAEGKNSFSTDRLVREEIHNYSNYKGKSIALGVSAVLSGDTLEQGEAQRREFMDVGKSGVGKTFGIGREQRSQEGVTIGSINTANLTIGDDAGQRLLTGESAAEAAKNANRGITLEHVKEHNGTTSVSFDADKVTRDITSTAQVMQGFDGTTQGIKHDLRKQADAYRERGDEETAAKLDKLVIGVDMLKGGLTPTDSALGTITNTAAPLVSYQIGQYAKAHGSEGSAGHIAAHAALAALTSAANGGSGTDMATSAAITGAAEYSAPQLAKLFYGKDISQLTAAEKSALGQTIGALATGAGAMTGGNSARAYNAGKSAQNAVENNYMASLRDYDKKPKVIQEHTDKLLAAGAMPFEKLDEKYENCNTDKDCHNAVEEEWRKESKKTAILEKELVEKGELELKHLNGYPSIKEQKDESYSSQMVRSANRSKTVLGQREAMSWNSIGKPQEADEALAIAISRNDDRLGLTERDRERWSVVAASSPGDWMANNKGLATRPLLTPKVEKNLAHIQAPAPKTESAKAEGKSIHPDLNIGRNNPQHYNNKPLHDKINYKGLEEKATNILLKEINKFPSKNKASNTATMIAAFDPKTGKIAVGASNGKVTADMLHPETVKYIEKRLGTKIGERTSFCNNTSGACAEVFAADKLVRQGVKPEDVKFTKAVRTKENYGETHIIPKAIVETCKNCMITWPEGGELK